MDLVALRERQGRLLRECLRARGGALGLALLARVGVGFGEPRPGDREAGVLRRRLAQLGDRVLGGAGAQRGLALVERRSASTDPVATSLKGRATSPLICSGVESSCCLTALEIWSTSASTSPLPPSALIGWPTPAPARRSDKSSRTLSPDCTNWPWSTVWAGARFETASSADSSKRVCSDAPMSLSTLATRSPGTGRT